MSFRRWLQRISAPFLEKTPSLYAACAVYYLLISILPTSAFFLSVLIYFPNASSVLLKQLFLMLPEPLHPSFSTILSVILHTSTPATLSVSGILSLWSSSKGIQTILNGLKHMMDTETTGSWLQRRLRAMAEFLLVLFFLLGTAGMIVFVYYTFQSVSKTVLPVLFLFPVLLSILYYGQSFLQISFSVCIISAFAASFAALVFSYVYSLYIRWFSSYDDFWGTFGAVILGLMWAHGLLVIILFGGRFAKRLSDEKKSSRTGLFHVMLRLLK